MQREFPIYGVEGEEAASNESVIEQVLNGDDEAVHVGHLVLIDMKKNNCRRLSTREHLVEHVLGIVLVDGEKIACEPSSPLRVLRQGRVYVHLESDVECAGGPVYVNTLTGGFCGQESTNTVQLARAFFLSSGRSGDVVLLEADLVGEDNHNEDYRRPRL